MRDQPGGHPPGIGHRVGGMFFLIQHARLERLDASEEAERSIQFNLKLSRKFCHASHNSPL